MTTPFCFALYGVPDVPNACPCGSHQTFVDTDHRNGKRGPFWVWCAVCGRSGPERPSRSLAVARWNRITSAGEIELLEGDEDLPPLPIPPPCNN